MSLITLAKFAAPVSSGIFAGYTWSLSDATIPSILAANDEATKARQWRVQYIQGFLVSTTVRLRSCMELTSPADCGTLYGHQRRIVAVPRHHLSSGTQMALHCSCPGHRYRHCFRVDVLASYEWRALK
jgi:hypothetical protein